MDYLKPGYFSKAVRADDRRSIFDCKNQVIVHNQTPVDVVFFGDSITEMWELGAYFHRADGMIVNRGIGGDRTIYGEKRFMADVVQLNPKLCVLMMGINDAWDMEFDHWRQLEGRSFDDVLSVAFQNIQSMVQMATQNGIQIAVCSVLPTNMNFTHTEPTRNEYVRQLNAKVSAYCRDQSLVYVDYYPLFLAEDGKTVRTELMIEGLHPHVLGYNLMADTLKTALKAYDFTL